MTDETPKWRAVFSLFLGLLALVVLIGGLGVWSVQARIGGAVVAPGMIELESNRQVVQHPEGGVVSEILVRDGDEVAAGDVLIRLEGSGVRSERAVVRGQLHEVLSRIARLEAEQGGEEDITFSRELLMAAEYSDEIARQIEGQRDLFRARNETVENTAAQLGEQITQIENQILGLESQYDGLVRQRELVESELESQQELLEQGLIQRRQVSGQQRELARLIGDIGRVEADIARSRGEIAALQIERLKLDATRREEAITQLRDLRANETELRERLRNLDETLDRLEVRAPVSGLVHGNQVFAVQSVVQAGQPIMYIIPQDQPLVVAVRVQPIHIDQVLLGQEAGLRFTAFDQRQTPEIDAYVSELSADVLTDEATGASFYRAELMPKDGQMERVDQPLLPGMPVEAYIHTGDRAPLTYLTKPLTDYFNRAMRE